MEPGLGVKGQKYKQYIYIYIYETPNKHSFSISKPSTETNAQNYYFLIYYNVIIYEIETHYFFFKSLIIYNWICTNYHVDVPFNE